MGRTFTHRFGQRFERRKKKRERRGLGFRWLLLVGGTQLATTNHKSVKMMGYIFGIRRAGR